MISVVIPTFQAAPTLLACLDSVLSQAAEVELEIIVVDDASTDGSVELLQPRLGPKLRLLRNEAHRGASHSRNRGMREARGEWITFVDADDELVVGALGALLTDAHASDADLLVGAHVKHFADRPHVLNRHGIDAIHPGGSVTLETAQLGPYVERYAEEPYTYTLLVHCWGKLFRKSVIEASGAAFDEELEQLEDVNFNFQVLRHCRRVRYVDTACYTHHIRSNDSMSARSGSEGDAVGKVSKSYASIARFLESRCHYAPERAESLVGRLLFTTCVIWLLRIKRRARGQSWRSLARAIEPIVTSPLVRRGMASYRLRPRDSRVVYFGVLTGSPLVCAAALDVDMLLRTGSH